MTKPILEYKDGKILAKYEGDIEPIEIDVDAIIALLVKNDELDEENG